MLENELLTADEVAKRLNVTTATVRHWTRNKLIPHLKIGMKTIRYEWDAVLEAVARSVGE